ncbi:MAG TPA: hypothetical protein VMT31_06175 [Methanomicrobiales archaeon]|nr:hypothetical protein [Methanomicrobiales archaeon]
MARKIATIGITINLENYENLRLEVQGEIGAEGDTEELIAFLDGMLARLGHGDEATAELVDAYRRRVIVPPGTGAASTAAARPVPARRGGEAAPAPPVQPAQPAAAPAPRPAATGPAPEAAPKPREARQQAEPPGGEPVPREEKPATVRVSPEGKAVKPAARPAARPEVAAPPAQVQEPVRRKVPAPQAPRETPREPAAGEQAPAAGRPKLAEGEVACEGCGAGITKNQEKLSKLLTGKSLCKRCMNP